MKKYLSLTIVAAGALTIIFFLKESDKRLENAAPDSFSNTSIKESKTIEQPAQWLAKPTPTNTSKQAASHSDVNWRSLELAFVKAQSFRAFYYDAFKKPEQGGYYYAFRALSTCKNLPKQAIADATPPRLHAVSELKYRCDFTDQDYADAQRQLDALREFRFSDDPLFSRIFDFLAATDQAQRSGIIKATIREGNPDVIASIVYSSVEESVFLSGSNRQQPPKYMKFAPSLIACELGADCGPNSTRALEICVHTGWCGGSVREELRAGLGGNFDTLNALVNRTVHHVRHEEFDKLAPGMRNAVNPGSSRSLYKPAADQSDNGAKGVRGIASDD